jgi:hypothetical protein
VTKHSRDTREIAHTLEGLEGDGMGGVCSSGFQAGDVVKVKDWLRWHGKEWTVFGVKPPKRDELFVNGGRVGKTVQIERQYNDFDRFIGWSVHDPITGKRLSRALFCDSAFERPRKRQTCFAEE